MTKVVSRTIEVTLVVNVTVSSEDAPTDKAACEYARNTIDLIGGNAIISEARVFDKWTDDDESKLKRAEFRKKYINEN